MCQRTRKARLELRGDVAATIGTRRIFTPTGRCGDLGNTRKKKAVAPEITPQSIAYAVWIVNQSAKRYRNAARDCYEVGAFQFATINKAKKEKLYGVKDRCIRWLISEGHLICKAKHGDRYLWSGLGFSFHSSAVPQVMPTNVSNERVFIEAKLNVKQSIRLKDAVFLIENIGGNAWNKTQKFAAEKLKRQNDD